VIQLAICRLAGGMEGTVGCALRVVYPHFSEMRYVMRFATRKVVIGTGGNVYVLVRDSVLLAAFPQCWEMAFVKRLV
jgi:hypothetical protein